MASWSGLRVDRNARVGSHVVIWTVVLVPTVIEMFRGWRPLLGDDATISLRAYQVLSSHPPLVGMHSDVSVPGHILYDLGPLQFFLLTVPVHIDHLQGALWGSALIIGIVLSVAVEAMWSVRRWMACVVVALAVADLGWTVPSLFGHQLWNADFGLAFLIASVVLAWAIALGSFGWWPVLVFTASVTIQAQLFYGLIVVSLLILSPLLGAWHSGWPKRFRWLLVGVGIGVLCWLPSLLQEAFGSYGNMSGLLTAKRQASLGLTFGLKNLGGIVWPGPLSLRQYNSNLSYRALGSEPVVAGMVVLILIATVAVAAWHYKRKDLAVLGTIGLICSLCTLIGFASVPRVNVGSLSWLVAVLWVIAYLWWIIIVWGAIELVRAFTTQKVPLHSRSSPVRSWAAIIPVLFAILLLGVWKLPSQTSVDPVSPHEGAQVSSVVRTIESRFSSGTVGIRFWPTPNPSTVTPENYVEYQYGQALLWQLTAAGFNPIMEPFFTVWSGVTFPRDPSVRIVNVVMTRDQWLSQIKDVTIGEHQSSSSGQSR